MNADPNLAAWMIAGGVTSTDPGAERSRAHARAFAARGGRSLVSRISAAIAARSQAREAARCARFPLETGCCAA